MPPVKSFVFEHSKYFFVDCSFLCNLITMYEGTLHMCDSHNDYAKNNDMLHAH